MKYTEVSNQKIIENLVLLVSLKEEIVLRCFIVPRVEYNEQYFRAIANLSNKYANISKVELMLYHDYGSHKFAPLDMEYWSDAPVSSTPKAKGAKWLFEIKRFEGKNIFIG